MKGRSIILLAFLLPLLSGCYIQRYHQTKDQYEAFKVELNKVKKTHTQYKARQQSLLDSIALYQQRILKGKDAITHADSMTEVYTIKIRELLGPDPWGDSVKNAARKAAKSSFMSDEEEDVIYWLNLARMQPDLYAELYLEPSLGLYDIKSWLETGTADYSMEVHMTYENSCYLEMAKMKGLNVLTPNLNCYQSAECHAKESGKTGYVGHDRTNCQEFFSGECCHYGRSDPFETILELLVDTYVPSLGHRHICLGAYSGIGVSRQPHKTYQLNTVLDFD
jgi:hypothetical protein